MKQRKGVFRTDLAYEECDEPLNSEEFSYFKEEENGVTMNHVKIHKEHNVLKRVVGDYYGMEFKDIYNEEVRKQLVISGKKILSKLLEKIPYEKVLVVGLGNEDVVADALGSKVCKLVIVSGHTSQSPKVAVIAPKVKAQTGMDTVEYIQSVTGMFHPDVVIVIDALLTASIARLNRVIQMTNTGIQPGSGISKRTNSLDKQTLQVDVIAIGISTVIDIESLVGNYVDIDEDIQKRIEQECNVMVTLKEMDFELLYLANILADIINETLFKKA